jgi:hypothetical protein
VSGRILILKYGWIVGVLGPIGWGVGAFWFYLPRFRRFALTLKAEDTGSWANIGRPDGTMVYATTPLTALIRIALPQVRGKIIRFFGLEGFRAVFEFEDVFVRSSSSFFVVCRFS